MGVRAPVRAGRRAPQMSPSSARGQVPHISPAAGLSPWSEKGVDALWPVLGPQGPGDYDIAATSGAEYSAPNCRQTVLAMRENDTMRSRIERSVAGRGVSLARQPCMTAASEYRSLPALGAFLVAVRYCSMGA